MKRSHAVRSAPKSDVSENISVGVAPASDDAAAVDVEQLIRTQAYLRAEKRGFAPGGALNDWLAAEQDWFPQGNRT